MKFMNEWMELETVILVVYPIHRNTNIACFLSFVDVCFDSSVMCFIWSIHRRKEPWERAFKIT